MPKQIITTEIEAADSHVWQLLTTPKEIEFWSPHVRELTMSPSGRFDVDTQRNFRLELQGKQVTLETRITHCIHGEMFAETPVGGSAGIHERVEYLKLIFRIIPLADKRCAVNFTLDYEMKGFLNKMMEKFILGVFLSEYKLWFERLKTYAETGRPV